MELISAGFCFFMAIVMGINSFDDNKTLTYSGAISGDEVKITWDKGLSFKSSDNSFELKINGRVHHDWAFMTEDSDINSSIGELDDGAEFRRAWLAFSGKLENGIFFKAQYGLEGGDVDFKDVYIGLTDIDYVGSLQIGHFKEAMSLDQLTGSNDITFIERSLANVFVPSRNSGIALNNAVLDERVTWNAGLFREADSFGSSAEDGAYNATARITGLPYYKETRLVHSGISYSRKTDHSMTQRYRERPEAHLSPRFVDTGNFTTDSVDIAALELAAQCKNLSIQGEYILSDNDIPTGDDPVFYGYYVYASYIITGEQRKYKKSKGVFGGIEPSNNFLDGNGNLGAWEIAIRYSSLDLDNQGIKGGELDDVTFGVNWYWNKQIRIMFNAINANLDHIGKAYIYLVRFQVSF